MTVQDSAIKAHLVMHEVTFNGWTVKAKILLMLQIGRILLLQNDPKIKLELCRWLAIADLRALKQVEILHYQRSQSD